MMPKLPEQIALDADQWNLHDATTGQLLFIIATVYCCADTPALLAEIARRYNAHDALMKVCETTADSCVGEFVSGKAGKANLLAMKTLRDIKPPKGTENAGI